jgi:hypothetical protein
LIDADGALLHTPPIDGLPIGSSQEVIFYEGFCFSWFDQLPDAQSLFSIIVHMSSPSLFGSGIGISSLRMKSSYLSGF